MLSLRILFISIMVTTISLSTPSARAEQFVITSIKPVHSLVAAVMEGVGRPGLIVKGASSPHDYALKPSQAAELEKADMIFWIGHGLEAFLKKPIETLGAKATIITLADTPDLLRLKVREGGGFEKHSDHGSHDKHDDHGSHDKHSDHGAFDTHFWVDPENAKIMARQIEAALSKADHKNAALYKTNTQFLITRLDALNSEIEMLIKPVRGKKFIVFHDAYQHFEQRFNIPASGSITLSPEVIPGAERVSHIQEQLKTSNISCVFTEPQFQPKLIKVLTEGTTTKIGTLDPLGATLTTGSELYFDLMRGMAKSMHDCLSQSDG